MIQRYNVSDKKMQALCSAACDAKSFLWNVFFGWRRTWRDDDGVEIMEFLLSSRLWKKLVWTHRYHFKETKEEV